MARRLRRTEGWGDDRTAGRRSVSLLSVAAIAMSAGSFVAGPLQYLVPAYNAMLPEMLAGGLLLLAILACPAGLALSYVALIVCPVGGPIRGRLLGWAGLALGYVAMFLWYAMFAGTMKMVAPWLLLLMAGVAMLHMVVFAAESTAGKYLVLTLLVSAPLLAALAGYLLQSRERARQLQCIKNLGNLGLGISQHQKFAPPNQSRNDPRLEWIEYLRVRDEIEGVDEDAAGERPKEEDYRP